MDQNQGGIRITIAALFAVAAISSGLSFGGIQLFTAVSDTAQESKAVSVESVTQQVSAQSTCDGTYARPVGGECVRSGETTYTVVLGTSTGTTTSPNPICEITPENPTLGDDITFDASSSTDPDGDITQYAWSITAADGDTFADSGVTTTLDGVDVDTAGEYSAEVGMVDDKGNTATTSCSTTVTSGTNTPPTANCTTSPTDPDEDDTIYFYGDSSNDPDGTIDTYSWEITDPDNNTTYPNGTPHDVSNPATGTYSAILTVEDNGGATSTDTCSIDVSTATTCEPGDPTEPPTDPASSNEPWVEISPTNSNDDYPNEGSSVTQSVSSNLTATSSCSTFDGEDEYVGDDGPKLLSVNCDVDASSTPPSTVSDSYNVCVQNVDPTAYDQNFKMTVDETLEDQSFNASDPVDSLDYIVLDNPDNGTVSKNGDEFTYEPNEDYYGSDSFQYQVDDRDGGVDTGTVTIDIYNNDPEASFSGPSELDYCQNNDMAYDGSASNDTRINNGNVSREDGDSGSVASYNWNTAPSRSTTITGGGSNLELNGPVSWTDPTDIELTVDDDEGATSTLANQEVTVDVPEYRADIIAPVDPQQIWITASSTKRSTKSTIKVTDINLPSEDFSTDYSFSDLQVDVSAPGIDPGVWETNASSSSNTFTVWADPQNQSEEIQFGTYDVTVEIELPLTGSCVWDKETVTIPLRAQTTSEF